MMTFAWVLAACSPAPTPAVEEPVSVPAREALHVAVIADPHIVSDDQRVDRLVAAVDAIEARAATEDISLVLVVGDIAWGDGLDVVRDAFEGLMIPWVPLVGDNEGHYGSGERFVDVFGPVWEARSGDLENWRMAETPITDALGGQAWVTNIAFTHKGVHFYGLDWASRSSDRIEGEFGTLHDVSGGTWPWWKEQLAADAPTDVGSVVTFTHIPMVLGMFDTAEIETFQTGLAPYQESLAVNLAGHLHTDIEVEVPDLWESWTTDATWDDSVRIRIAHGTPTDEGWVWNTEGVEVPYDGDR